MDTIGAAQALVGRMSINGKTAPTAASPRVRGRAGGGQRARPQRQRELASDPRFVTNPQRNAHRDALKQLLEAKLTQFEGEPLADRLVRAAEATPLAVPVRAAQRA